MIGAPIDHVVERGPIDIRAALGQCPNRHGTQVAGLIAAAANNGIGIVGVAPDVKLLAYKACWQTSATSAGRCNSFTLAQALADAMAARAQIINLSLVGPSDPLLAALIEKATESGLIVVGAVSADPRFSFPRSIHRRGKAGWRTSPA